MSFVVTATYTYISRCKDLEHNHSGPNRLPIVAAQALHKGAPPHITLTLSHRTASGRACFLLALSMMLVAIIMGDLTDSACPATCILVVDAGMSV